MYSAITCIKCGHKNGFYVSVGGGGGGSNINDDRPEWEKSLDWRLMEYRQWALNMEKKLRGDA